MAYYDVFGTIEEDFSVQIAGYTVLFQADANVNVGHKETEYFWIIIDAVMPYILDEERELPYISEKKNIFKQFKERISLLFKTENAAKHMPTRPRWEAVVKIMYVQVWMLLKMR